MESKYSVAQKLAQIALKNMSNKEHLQLMEDHFDPTDEITTLDRFVQFVKNRNPKNKMSLIHKVFGLRVDLKSNEFYKPDATKQLGMTVNMLNMIMEDFPHEVYVEFVKDQMASLEQEDLLYEAVECYKKGPINFKKLLISIKNLLIDQGLKSRLAVIKLILGA